MSPRPRVSASPRLSSPASRVPSPESRIPHPAPRAFTLIELLVVIAIIVLLIGIAVPVLGPAMNSGQQSQMVQQLTGAITIAQSRAINQGGYAIRIERAFMTNSSGFMLDANGQPSLVYDNDGKLINNTAFSLANAPVWLDYQQIRYLKPSRVNPCYEPTIDDVIKLPPNVWLAPDYALTYDGFTAERSPNMRLYYNLSSTNNLLLNTVWSVTFPARRSQRFNPFETFCIVFDQRGQVVELRRYDIAQSDKYAYQDQTQPYIESDVYKYRTTKYPYASARGVILYDRKQFDLIGGDMTAKAAYLTQKGRPFFVNRFVGSLVEGRTQ